MSRPRRLAFLSGLQLFPAESGGQLRSAGIVKALAARGWDVAVYSLVGRKADYLAGKPSGVERIDDRVSEYVERNRLWAAVQLACYRLALPPLWIAVLLRIHTPKRLKALLAECDAVVADFPYLWAAAKRSGKPFALNTHNVEADLWPKAWIKRLVRAIERKAARAADRVVCCAPGDLAHFAAVAGEGRTLLVPNGVDPARFEGLGPHRAPTRARLGYKDSDCVLLFAASSFAPNAEGLAFLREWAARNQALLASRGVELLVVGSVAKDAERLPHLTITGKVPAVEPYFAAADLALNCVFRGSGSNVKMLEYMAAGLAILTTAAGTRGFSLQDGRDCVVFDGDTLTAVLGATPLLRDADARLRMAASARERNLAQLDLRHGVAPLAAWLDAAK